MKVRRWICLQEGVRPQVWRWCAEAFPWPSCRSAVYREGEDQADCIREGEQNNEHAEKARLHSQSNRRRMRFF